MNVSIHRFIRLPSLLLINYITFYYLLQFLHYAKHTIIYVHDMHWQIRVVYL